MSQLVSYGLPVLFVLVFFQLFIIRPQKKQMANKRLMIESLKVGDNVETTSGIVGTVTSVNEDTFEVLTLDSKIEFRKYALVNILSHMDN